MYLQADVSLFQSCQSPEVHTMSCFDFRFWSSIVSIPDNNIFPGLKPLEITVLLSCFTSYVIQKLYSQSKNSDIVIV